MAEAFRDARITLNGVEIACTIRGSGPAVLLLHGFPQTRAMWRPIAARLAEQFTVVAADLRGYGASSQPGRDNPHDSSAYSFRAMGQDQLALMAALGHERFHLVGHDRGARVAHRMALDAPERVARLVLMDIVPTQTLLRDLTHGVAASYYHWFFLAQPHPFPERLIGADPDYFFESCLLGWGGARLSDFDAELLAEYRAAWRRCEVIFAMCQDYRAAIAHDLALDEADLHRQVTCPALVLYGAEGVMAREYDVAATWAPRLAQMQVAALPGGHFFPDTAASETAEAVARFLTGCARSG
ncbi:MAG: alpha/beta hydrolase [Natronohydrobacter sp.]|nr:alpha/beta hydrolase [Natronohydrobacter sp.]